LRSFAGGKPRQRASQITFSGNHVQKYDRLNRSTNVLFLFAFVICFCVSAHSQTPKEYERAIAQSRKIIADTMAKQHIPGLSIAVAVNEKIIWSEGFGFADLENQVRVTSATRFRIASVSKPFTAAAMARLYEQGKLDLDAPVHRYVPNFPRKAQEITTRQLVGHLSGIRHYKRDPDESKDEFYNQKHYTIVMDSLKIFQNDPLQSAPGRKYAYSSYGYTLLSAVIEGASEQEFLTAMQELVFKPLNMNSSSADENKKIIPNRTRFYSLDANKQLVNASYIDRSYSFAGGGFLSNTEDLVRFGAAHLSDGFLKEETRKQMFTSQRTSDGKETGVGFGWRISKDKEGRLYYFHPGENVGGRSYLLMYPDKKVVVAMLHNLTGASLASIIDISKLFVAEKP
jgi:serine beta-lactamase-like protein LACTB